jgi:DNA-binding MurR/RpiR family transcriptional regulator
LSLKHRRLARYVLANTGSLAFATAAEVGESAGVSAATAVRFAQTIGYQGFTDLRESLRDGLKSFQPTASQLQELISHPPATPDEHVNHVFRQAYQALEETVEHIDPQVLLSAANELAKASRIVLVGTGISSSVLALLEFHLGRIGMRTVRPRDMSEFVSVIAGTTSKDVVFATTYWRFLRSTSDWLRIAKQNGATTIAMTDSAVFPAQDYVDHSIVVTSKGLAHGSSMVSSIAAVDTITSLLVTIDPDRFLAAIDRSEAVFRETHILLE